MSHIVTIKSEVRDAVAVEAACERLHLEKPVYGTARLFSGSASGLLVQLPEWQYPVVCQTETGQLQFDNFENRWGDRSHLDRFLQLYAVEKTRLSAQAGLRRTGTAAGRRIDQAHHTSGRCRMKAIEITISPSGTSIIQTKGFSGSACQQASKFLEQALGACVAERLTLEFYQAQPSKAINTQRA